MDVKVLPFTVRDLVPGCWSLLKTKARMGFSQQNVPKSLMRISSDFKITKRNGSLLLDWLMVNHMRSSLVWRMMKMAFCYHAQSLKVGSSRAAMNWANRVTIFNTGTPEGIKQLLKDYLLNLIRSSGIMQSWFQVCYATVCRFRKWLNWLPVFSLMSSRSIPGKTGLPAP